MDNARIRRNAKRTIERAYRNWKYQIEQYFYACDHSLMFYTSERLGYRAWCRIERAKAQLAAIGLHVTRVQICGTVDISAI